MPSLKIFASVTGRLLGDVNSDGQVNVSDVTETQRIAASVFAPDALTARAADVNGDGIVNVVDATEIQKYIAGYTSENNINKPI